MGLSTKETGNTYHTHHCCPSLTYHPVTEGNSSVKELQHREEYAPAWTRTTTRLRFQLDGILQFDWSLLWLISVLGYKHKTRSNNIIIHFSASEHNHTFTSHSWVGLVPVDVHVSVKRSTEVGAVGSSVQLSGDVVLKHLERLAFNRSSSLLVELASSSLDS